MAVHTIEEIHAEAERQGRIIDEQKEAEQSSTVTAKKHRSRKKTAVEVMNESMEEEAADAKALIEEAEASEPDGRQQPAAQDRTDETGETDGTAEEAAGDETPAKKPAKRDWVKEAYECFVKDAKDIDPTDPVKAIEAYFEKNATDELKARCKAEGKDAKGCWKFIEEVARKALHGSSGHIDPAVVYAIAMHWFEDVPKDWDAASAKAPARQAKPAKAAKKRKSKTLAAKQGFFFEMLETPAESEVKE